MAEHTGTILVIDDNRDLANLLTQHLSSRGFTVATAASGAAGLALAADLDPRLILLDLRLPDMSGLDVLGRIRVLLPAAEVVIITGYPEFSSALAAIKGRVVDYLCKPFRLGALDGALTRVFGAAEIGGTERPVREARAGRAALRMVGTSDASLALRVLIRQLAVTGVRAVLITGESGTGKDLAARLLHADGQRADGPFIAVNCSAVSETLFESEFFGHERGAFTGAIATRRGFVQMADSGTLFLDEVGEIPLSCQAKLLRFLDDQTLMRVGGGQSIQVDVQIVAATNRDLRAMVAQGAFRSDLFFRLNVAPIEITPLRERPQDILPLAAFCLDGANARYGKRVPGFTPEAERLLESSRWPGNVRELRNLVERLVILSMGAPIEARDLPAELFADAVVNALGSHVAAMSAAGAAPARSRREVTTSLSEANRAHILEVLARVNGNKTQAAKMLGISRQTLRSKLTT
ncbi:MAG: sigma-54 dependent transcriptional regulator [candidate division NC10 bacterium]